MRASDTPYVPPQITPMTLRYAPDTVGRVMAHPTQPRQVLPHVPAALGTEHLVVDVDPEPAALVLAGLAQVLEPERG